jgi:hypothetical protein
MPGTEWVSGLTVAKLKDELKKRGQAVSGKKAELVARLTEHITEHEVRQITHRVCKPQFTCSLL